MAKLVIALRSLSTGAFVSAWDSPHVLVANRSIVGTGEQFEVVIVDGELPVPGPPAPPLPPIPDLPRQGDMSDRDWFMALVDGKPFGQQTVLDLEPTLNANGWQLTPPNANGERTKVFGAKTKKWIRVGFGEKRWVWMVQ